MITVIVLVLTLGANLGLNGVGFFARESQLNTCVISGSSIVCERKNWPGEEQ